MDKSGKVVIGCLAVSLVALFLMGGNRKAISFDDEITPSGGLPSGVIVFINSGTCPTGYTEVSSSGNYILLTTAAGGGVGTTGGSASYTPAGTNGTVNFTPQGTIDSHTVGAKAGTSGGNVALTAPTTHTFTGTQGTVTAQTFTGTPATIQPPFLKLIGCKKD